MGQVWLNYGSTMYIHLDVRKLCDWIQ